MENENKSSGKAMSFLERMKQRSQAQKKYGDDFFQPKDTAEIDTQDCPNCGAGRAKRDGVTLSPSCAGIVTNRQHLCHALFLPPNRI